MLLFWWWLLALYIYIWRGIEEDIFNADWCTGGTATAIAHINSLLTKAFLSIDRNYPLSGHINSAKDVLRSFQSVGVINCISRNSLVKCAALFSILSQQINNINTFSKCNISHCVKSVQIRSFFPHSDQKKLHIWTLFTQWVLLLIIWKYINRIRNDHTRAIEERQNDFGIEAEKLNVLKVI